MAASLGGILGMFNPTAPAAAPLPTAPSLSADDAQANANARIAADRQRSRALGTTSRRDTLLTGPSGITTPAPVVRKTLLGQ
jgi:hypothetical protein